MAHGVVPLPFLVPLLITVLLTMCGVTENSSRIECPETTKGVGPGEMECGERLLPP